MSDNTTLDDIAIDESTDFNYSDVVNYNPLGDNVEEKDYQKANIQSVGRLPDLEEPTFEPPSLEDISPEMFGSGGGGEDEDDIFGQERLNDLPKEDKKKAAEQLTEMVLEGYSSICDFAGNFASVNEGQLMQMQTDGKIDLTMPIPVSPTERVGVVDFVQSYNSQITEALEVTDEFKDSVRKPMTRIFQKREMGMTDEQYLLVMFGKDMITKGATTFALKKQLTQTLELVYEQYRANGYPPPPPPQPPVTPPPPPPSPQPQAEQASPEEGNRRQRRASKKKSKKAKIRAPK